MGRVASTAAGLVLLMVLMAGRPALAATELHGADSSFRAEGITILWAILKGSSDENSFVHIRILHDAAAAPAITLFGVEAVDPFSKERAWVVKGVPLRTLQTLKTVRTDFQGQDGAVAPFLQRPGSPGEGPSGADDLLPRRSGHGAGAAFGSGSGSLLGPGPLADKVMLQGTEFCSALSSQ